MKKIPLLALALAVAALGLVACGGSDETTSGGAETQSESAPQAGGEGQAEGGTAGSAAVVDIETPAGSELKYTTDSASAKAGVVSINFTNAQAIPHDVAIEDEAGETIAQTDVISEDSQSIKGEFEPGTYKFYCSIPGHREAGMEGTLTIE